MSPLPQDTLLDQNVESKEYPVCEEKKEASSTQENLTQLTLKLDCFSETLPTSTVETTSVASLWEEITWYPVFESGKKLSSPRRRKNGPPPRRWIGVQGSVVPYESPDKEDGVAPVAMASPIFRHAAAFVAGEPIQAVQWTPSVAALRPQNSNMTYNHVTLEAWQWLTDTDSTATSSSKRSIIVTPERIDPSLDLLPGSSVVRILLTGSLQKHSGNHRATSPIGGGHLTLRSKRYDTNNTRRRSPRPQKVFPLRPGTMVTVPWETQQSTTYEIALEPPTFPIDQASTHDSMYSVTLLLTFRQVITNLIQSPERPPRVLGQWPAAVSSSSQPFLSDPQAEWKRISEAFGLEKRQEGLSCHELYGPGSPLLPEARLRPCAAKVHIEEDLWSLATPRSSATTDTSAVSCTTPNRLTVMNCASPKAATPGSPPVRNIAVPRTNTALALLVVDLQNDFLVRIIST
jgi:hypothetical protein